MGEDDRSIYATPHITPICPETLEIISVRGAVREDYARSYANVWGIAQVTMSIEWPRICLYE